MSDDDRMVLEAALFGGEVRPVSAESLAWAQRIALRVKAETERAVAAERAACAKIADDYRKSAVDSGVPQIILLGGAAQIIRNRIRER